MRRTSPNLSKVIVSPHLDDAIFSLFGTLGGDSEVIVITVCAGLPEVGTPPSGYDHLTGSNDPTQRMKLRRKEDEVACDIAEWSFVHLDFLDAPYVASKCQFEVTQALRETLPSNTSEVYIPAAIGEHPDHTLVRDAALALELGDSDRYLYADYPYAATYGWPSRITGLETQEFLDIDYFYSLALDSLPKTILGPEIVTSLTSKDSEAKLEVMRLYTTQFEAMEKGPSLGLSHPDRLAYELMWKLLR